MDQIEADTMSEKKQNESHTESVGFKLKGSLAGFMLGGVLSFVFAVFILDIFWIETYQFLLMGIFTLAIAIIGFRFPKYLAWLVPILGSSIASGLNDD